MDYSNKKDNETPNVIARRSFLVGTGAAAIGLAWWYVQQREPVRAEAAAAGLPKMVTIVEFSDSGQREGKKSVDRVVKSEEEWKKLLQPASFDVTRQAGTE